MKNLPMEQNRANDMFGPVSYKIVRKEGRPVRVIDKSRTSPERVEVEVAREQMLKGIAATNPVPRGIFSRKCTPRAVAYAS